MKKTLITLTIIALGVFTACSSDDNYSGDDSLPQPPIIEEVDDVAYIEVTLKGVFNGSILIYGNLDDYLRNNYVAEYVDDTFIVEDKFETINDHFYLQLVFGNTISIPNYEPAIVKITTKLNDQIITQIDTIVPGPSADMFYYDETIEIK